MTLHNGITVVAERHPYVRSVSIGVWVRVGSSHEGPKQNGVSHFIEHMVFKGTESRTSLDIATVLEQHGGDLNAFTDREVTCYHATVLREHLGLALDVLSDLLLRPKFDRLEMERERKVLLQEMAMVQDSPDDWIGDLLLESIWQDDPLGKPIMGSRKTIRAMSRAQLVGFFEEHYRAENIVVSVAGNFEFEELEALCDRFFTFQRTQGTMNLPRMVAKYHSRKRSLEMPTEQLHLLIGFEAMSVKDPYRFDALIMSFFLGGGMSSRLFQEVREKAALAYSIDCEYAPFTAAGLFTISVAMSYRSLERCLEIIGRELERLKQESLLDKDLDLVKGQLKGTILLAGEHMETRQESIGRNEIVFGRYISPDEVVREIDQVTPVRIQELAHRIFIPSKESCVALGKQKFRSRQLSIWR